jgi:hypothetical protein
VARSIGDQNVPIINQQTEFALAAVESRRRQVRFAQRRPRHRERVDGIALAGLSWIEQPGVASFGALRCYTDIINGDNVENIRDLGTSDQHIYCIAYNVVVSQATPPPTEAPTSTPVATPTECVVGVADAAAVATDTSCPTPFESFQGETATPGQTTTPPPTSTDGNDPGNNSTPLFALLIWLAFGGLGFAAVEMQRRSIRR